MKNFLLVTAWLWIALPLGWGVYQSIQKSLPLFDGASNAVNTIQKMESKLANHKK